MDKQFKRIQELITLRDRNNADVSIADVGWHLYHILKTLKVICEQMAMSQSLDYKWKFNFIREMIQLTGRMPRGRGKSPKAVKPPSQFTQEDIELLLIEAKNVWDEAQQLQSDQFFIHPLFGKYNKKAAMRFIIIHSNHHLRIITDILRTA